MKRIEGRLILTFKDDPTESEILAIEQYLNSTVANMLYANMHTALRVHLQEIEDDTSE
jgi:hypothetical protein